MTSPAVQQTLDEMLKIFNAMSPAGRLAVAKELKAKVEAERARNQLGTYYPDTGPLRRELYKKHLEFFAATLFHNEVAFVGANRCVAPWTVIETPRGQRQIGETLGGSTFDVRAWDGASRSTATSSPGFVKGIEPAFRVHLDTGNFFDCSRRHRVLTTEGWLSLDQIVRASSGWRFHQTIPDYRASCDEDGRPCDGQLLLGEDSGPEQFPLEGGVPLHGRLGGRTGAAGRTQGRIRACLERDLPSNPHDRDPISDLFCSFEAQAVLRAEEWCFEIRRELRRFVDALDRRGASRRFGLLEDRPSETRGGQPLELHRSVSSRSVERFARVSLGAGLSTARFLRGEVRLESLRGEICREIILASEGPRLIGGARVDSVVPIGYTPIMDVTVPKGNNYFAHGAYHHNSGKTHAVCYAAAVFMTGRYPKWWVGRRFDRPVTVWFAGEDAKAVRESLQEKLLGRPGQYGTGLIPGKELTDVKPRAGVADTIDFFNVMHVSGKKSRGVFKAYEQGRESFQSAAVDVIILDEEPDMAIYTESLTRTLSTKPGQPNGLILASFTPLKGLSEVVLQFLPGGKMPQTLEERKKAWGF